MGSIKVADSKEYLLKDGKPFFIFADTVWSAFSNTSNDDWAEYLEYRRMQGFNSLQISVLPILHDTSDTYIGLNPFELNADGSWNFSAFNTVFWDRAAAMVALACSKGFVPILTLLWGNYVPGNWMSRMNASHVIPLDLIAAFTRYTFEKFAPYKPIYYVSGDINFENNRLEPEYRIALETLRSLSSDTLLAMHISGGVVDLPDELYDSELIDMYIYQSSHMLQTQTSCFTYAELFEKKVNKRPIFNSEPCYEGHGHFGLYGRFGAFDVRKAFWWSVLAGGRAGFTYGAHGIFSWHKHGAHFINAAGSKTPFEWRTALRLDGAWDAAFSTYLVNQYKVWEFSPAQTLLSTDYEGQVRIAATGNFSTLAIYMPYSVPLDLKLDLDAYELTAFDLRKRNPIQPPYTTDGLTSKLELTELNADIVILAKKKQ